MPASSDITASRLLSGQFPDQRSGTSVTARPDEQLEPNRPICSLLLAYIERRDSSEAFRVDSEWEACTVSTSSDWRAIIPTGSANGKLGEFSRLLQRRAPQHHHGHSALVARAAP